MTISLLLYSRNTFWLQNTIIPIVKNWPHAWAWSKEKPILFVFGLFHLPGILYYLFANDYCRQIEQFSRTHDAWEPKLSTARIDYAGEALLYRLECELETQSVDVVQDSQPSQPTLLLTWRQ